MRIINSEKERERERGKEEGESMGGERRRGVRREEKRFVHTNLGDHHTSC